MVGGGLMWGLVCDTQHIILLSQSVIYHNICSSLQEPLSDRVVIKTVLVFSPFFTKLFFLSADINQLTLDVM